MSQTTKYDYSLLKHEYVTSDITIKALAEKHSVISWSTVYQRARKENWELERKRFKDRQFEHSIEAVMARRAMKMAELQDEMVDVIRGTLTRMAINLQNDDYIVTPDQLVKLIQSVQLLTGGPTSREEVHGFNVNTDLPVELLRELQSQARSNGSGAKPVGQSALPIAEGARKIN